MGHRERRGDQIIPGTHINRGKGFIMGIFSRFGFLVRANVDDLITRSEDPEKMLNQALTEVAYQLIEARKQVVVAIADEKRFRSQWEGELRAARHWKDRAKIAVRAGDDGLAKEALFRRREHEELAAEFQKQWEAHRQGVDQLKAALQMLNTKLRDAKRKKHLLVAKQKRAQAQRLIHETLVGLTESSALETFNRMEMRINQIEAEAEAASEMMEQMTGDTLAQRFVELEAATGVDMDLLELKEEMGVLLGAGQTELLSHDFSGRRRRYQGEDEVYVEVGATPARGHQAYP